MSEAASGFDYRFYFERLQDAKRLQLPQDEVTWVERYEKPSKTYDVVLYLGCNILRTPHVAADVVKVFEALGVDFIPVGGVQFCCGVVWDNSGDVEPGKGVSQRTTERLTTYGASKVVMWCPSCSVHFDDIVIGRDERHTPFGITTATEFLSDLAERGAIPWKDEVRARAVLHTHVGDEHSRTGQLRARADARAASSLLKAVPGLELLDDAEAPPALGYDCGAASSVRLPREEFLGIRRSLVSDARDRGADTLVTISHACQREWCDEADDDFQVRNYISLVADALGIERRYAEPLAGFKNGMTEEEILDASRDVWQSHGLTEPEARRLITKYAWDSRSPRLTAP